MPGMSDAVEVKLLDHMTGVTPWTVTAPLYLALVTVAVTDAMTAATITEAAYTGYARKSVAAADWAAAVSPGGTKATQNALAFAPCTSGSATIIGWALCTSSSGAGDINCYGTCTSTVISTTQSPATVPVGALSIAAD